MFHKQNLDIYDSVTKASFEIREVEAIPEPDFTDNMTFKTLSPIVLSKNSDYKGQKSELYLKPEDKDYFYYFKKNLEEKYISFCNTTGTQILEYKLNDFILHDDSKPKLITIREGTDQETQVKGYYCTFTLKGHPEFIKLGYFAGFGKLTSLGFGCVKIIPK